MISSTLLDRFLHICSHELRGPVCTIHGLVKLAQEHPQEVNVDDCLKKIGECNHKMDLVIRSLQEFIAIESAATPDIHTQMMNE